MVLQSYYARMIKYGNFSKHMQCLYYAYAGVGTSRDPTDPQSGIPQERTLRQKRTILCIFPLISTKNWSKNNKETKFIVKNTVDMLNHTNFGNLDFYSKKARI